MLTTSSVLVDCDFILVQDYEKEVHHISTLVDTCSSQVHSRWI